MGSIEPMTIERSIVLAGVEPPADVAADDPEDAGVDEAADDVPAAAEVLLPPLLLLLLQAVTVKVTATPATTAKRSARG
jgi:hypothetical protein